MALTPRTTKVDILQGEDNERLADLYQDVQVAERQAHEAKLSGAPLRGGDEAPDARLTEAREALRAFAAEAAERAVTVRLRSIGRGRFRDLRREHEPRMVKRMIDGEETEVVHEDDQRIVDIAAQMGMSVHAVNTETFPEALLNYADTSDPEIRTIYEPEFNTSAERRRFLDDELAEGDFERVWLAAFFMNATGGNDPKAVTASLRMFDETSE